MNTCFIDSHKEARSRSFTLIELLVVVAIIGILAGLLLPALSKAVDRAHAIQCLANLRGLGTAMGTYTEANDGCFWPYKVWVEVNGSAKGCYFWGTDTRPVRPEYSPFMQHVDAQLPALWCPSFPWGSYVPQGAVDEPTTTYGYNAFFLVNPSTKRLGQIPKPSELFVFNDSALQQTFGVSVPVFKNNTYLEPVSGSWVQTPTSHFRHNGKTQSLCADGHAEAFGLEGGSMKLPDFDLSFVGTHNDPHYAQ